MRGSPAVSFPGRNEFTIVWRSSLQGSSVSGGTGLCERLAINDGSSKFIGPPAPNIAAKPLLTHWRFDSRLSNGSTCPVNDTCFGGVSQPASVKTSVMQSYMVRQPIMFGA